MAHERAGQLAQPSDLIDIAELVTAYYTRVPDVENPDQQVVFGTSGHRGSALDAAFNERHILAITQAIVDYRKEQGTTGAIFVGRDTHALSEPAMVSALEVLLANEVEVRVDDCGRYTPTPAISHAILTHPGTPTIFYDHFYADGLGDSIRELVKIRKRAGLHCRSKARPLLGRFWEVPD